MVDVLEEEQELEDEANAVLGSSDDQNCTFPQGYVNRQALYSCKTCTGENGELAGICLACSYACHEGHELIELYTKRNFCCDCGNQKMPQNPCKLFPYKSPKNTENSYNHNFRGTYCVCSRPYPDPDATEPEVMIQCVVCEDWLHAQHLGSAAPSDPEITEMICGSCMAKNECLWPYTVHSVGANVVKVEKEFADNDTLVSMDEEEPAASSEQARAGLKRKRSEDDSDNETDKKKRNSVEERNADEPKAAAASATTASDSDASCKCPESSPQNKPVTSAVFWPDGWRKKLCSCEKCKEMYLKSHLQFLIESQDTVSHYVNAGKAKQSGESQYDRGMEALSRLDRVRQVEAIHEYNNMKGALKDFFKTFADNKQTVKKEDIEKFFNQMKERRRQTPNVQIPHFCR